MHILITGGVGYIGSHMTALFAENSTKETPYTITIFDNYSNSDPDSLLRLKKLTPSINFVEVDLTDKDQLDKAFKLIIDQHGELSAVFHFAGLKSVSDSISEPIHYYQNNISGSLNLCDAMDKYNVRTLIFSSSATVYGQPETLPLGETCHTSVECITNPYGRSKMIFEEILDDISHSDPRWKIAILRYFNPIGAHDSGFIGERPKGVPNNIMPFICDVANKKQKKLTIFGSDYDTPDGTGVRDYIHVIDLVQGHFDAFIYIQNHQTTVLRANLGTGIGYSVKELVDTFSQENNVEIPYSFSKRREGDVASVYADNSFAKEVFGWLPRYTLTDMVKSHWYWCKV